MASPNGTPFSFQPGAVPRTSNTLTHVRAQTLMGAEPSPNQSAQLLVTHWPPYFLYHQPLRVLPRKALHHAVSMCAPRWPWGGYNVCPVTPPRKDFWQRAACVRSALPPVAASGCAFTAALGVHNCCSRDCVTVPRQLCAPKPAAAPQVAGTTQMSNRRAGCNLISEKV